MPSFKTQREAEMYLKERKAQKDEQDKREERSRRHDWRITVFNVVGGAIAGGIVSFFVSLVFWLLTTKYAT